MFQINCNYFADLVNSVGTIYILEYKSVVEVENCFFKNNIIDKNNSVINIVYISVCVLRKNCVTESQGCAFGLHGNEEDSFIEVSHMLEYKSKGMHSSYEGCAGSHILMYSNFSCLKHEYVHRTGFCITTTAGSVKYISVEKCSGAYFTDIHKIEENVNMNEIVVSECNLHNGWIENEYSSGITVSFTNSIFSGITGTGTTLFANGNVDFLNCHCINCNANIPNSVPKFDIYLDAALTLIQCGAAQICKMKSCKKQNRIGVISLGFIIFENPMEPAS